MKWVRGRKRDICVIGEEDKKDQRRREILGMEMRKSR